MHEHGAHCTMNPNHKGPYFCSVTGCPKKDRPFKMKKLLNKHMRKEHSELVLSATWVTPFPNEVQEIPREPE